MFTLAWPYRDAKENWVESVLLACLTVIGVLNLGLTAMYQEDKAQTIKTVVKIISSAPLCVVLCTVFMAVAGKRCIKKRQEQSECFVYLFVCYETKSLGEGGGWEQPLTSCFLEDNKIKIIYSLIQSLIY